MLNDSDGEPVTMSLRDWRQALRTPPSYRVGSSSLRLNTKVISLVLIITIAVFVFLYYVIPISHIENYHNQEGTVKPDTKCNWLPYNATYPLTKPIRTGGGITFRIGIISDLDTNSKYKTHPNLWVSYLQKGYLSWNPSLRSVTVSWDKIKIQLESSYSQGGRGMELSDLVVFNGKLYTLDDRTGIVYEIVDNRVLPWVILPDGDGKSVKGFKSEWATVKNEQLVIGGLGKEWTNTKGEILNFDPQWIKEITPRGEVQHSNWRDRYLSLRQSVGVTFPGYMIHESVAWSSIHQKWFFLPRRSSKQSYRDDTDEVMGTNLLLTCDINCKEIQVIKVGDIEPSHGFSSFKFIPGSDDSVIVAIKSEEVKGSTASYILAFTIDGKILMPETKIGDLKYEGIEFI